MVLEILSGGELFDRIVKKGHYSERDASQLTSVIVKALGALHSVGILHRCVWRAEPYLAERCNARSPSRLLLRHPPQPTIDPPRDLKPENCIYSTTAEDSSLKITDFGLAVLLTPESDRLIDRHLVGTPGYIAPEILNNYEYSPAADLWAAGVILFILLSGSPPFYGRTHKEIFEKIKAGQWGFNGRNWGQVSDAAKDLVTKMLKQAPGERLTLAGVLEHPWIREHESVPAAHLPGTLDSLAKFNARQKFRAAAMVCIGSSRLQRVLAAMAGDKAGAGAGDKKGGEEAALAGVDLSVFTPEELERLKEEFSKAAGAEGGKSSSDRSSCLTLAQFEGVMATLGLDHLPVARLFHAFDQDGTGDVDYREFLLGVSKFRLRGPESLKFCFQVFDEDNSGSISREELTKVLVHTRRRSQLAGAGAGAGGAAPGHHARKSTADASVASLAASRSASPPLGGAGPMVLASDDGETAQLVPAAEGAAERAAAGKPALCERTEPRYMEMDPDAYEVAESIAELFESLDTNHDNEVTLEEFLAGVERHPELLAVLQPGAKDEEAHGQAPAHGALRGGVSV